MIKKYSQQRGRFILKVAKELIFSNKKWVYNLIDEFIYHSIWYNPNQKQMDQVSWFLTY